jgi:hypothetical protein
MHRSSARSSHSVATLSNTISARGEAAKPTSAEVAQQNRLETTLVGGSARARHRHEAVPAALIERRPHHLPDGYDPARRPVAQCWSDPAE